MTFSYYPGCTLKTKAKELDAYARRSAEALGITLAELPESFSRKDIEKLNESRKALYEDNENYIKAHENDPEFEEYRLAQEKKKEEERERVRRIEQAKKELAKHNKRKK